LSVEEDTMMKKTVPEKLFLLRKALQESGLEACMIPSADPHQSEYTAPYAQFRAWVSGFTGSSGRLVVGAHSAGLWTDSRYFLQAEEELKGSGIGLFKSNLAETPTPEEWIHAQGYRSVGLDGSVFCTKEALLLTEFFSKKGILLDSCFEPYEQAWPERPARPANPFFLFPESLSGESVSDKLSRIRSEMAKIGVEILPLAMLDEIAWLYNLRGSDIEFNPVGICYACVGMEDAYLFADQLKIPAEVEAWLSANGIRLESYEALPDLLRSLKHTSVLLDPDKINHRLSQSIPSDCPIIEGVSPVTSLKAVKNSTELEGYRRAMIKDGIALTRFRVWLEERLKANDTLDEFSIARQIATFRAQQKGYVCDSFAPIVSYGDHGAVVHYEPSPETSYPVKAEGVLLTDTGGQYLDGTTDITRTMYLGDEVPEAFKEDYTSLLKGVIALSSAVFPVGTRGAQLDVLARQYIWKRNINFLHGTGHGVGHFLNVHEGPQSIRMNENPTPLVPGMVVTNEPGIYRTGIWGVRIENVLQVRTQNNSDFGSYLCFETLTLFPLEKECMQLPLLQPDEIRWIDQYHQNVYEKLAPYLDEAEKNWLKLKTQPIA
jgi:Xaa-Pro aminopeptidase